MKRFTAIILSLLLIISACFCANAAVGGSFATGEKVVFKMGGWAYEKVSSYGYEIDEYYGEDTELNLPWTFAKEYVNSIGDHAFNENKTLVSIDTTSVLKTIGDYAFNGCKSLSKVTLYNSIVALGAGCFYNDSALKSINLQATSITAVPAYCFAQCGLGSVALPTTCTAIGNYAFYNSSNLLSVNIPDSVTSIADTAFDGCGNLVFVCSEGSYAAEYAAAKGFDVIFSEDFMLGDVNHDNKISIRDVTFIQLHMVGKTGYILDNVGMVYADVNSDGKVNIRDVTCIQLYKVGKITSFDNLT